MSRACSTAILPAAVGRTPAGDPPEQAHAETALQAADLP